MLSVEGILILSCKDFVKTHRSQSKLSSRRLPNTVSLYTWSVTQHFTYLNGWSPGRDTGRVILVKRTSCRHAVRVVP